VHLYVMMVMKHYLPSSSGSTLWTWSNKARCIELVDLTNLNRGILQKIFGVLQLDSFHLTLAIFRYGA